MTISATSQGAKPGVCTSSNRPANPYTGMMIFETDTNKLGVWNGSEWKFFIDVDTPPALELVKTQTIGSAVSSVTVSDVFSSIYDAYKIIITGGAASTDMQLNWTLGSTTSGYYWSTDGRIFGGSVSSATEANSSAWKFQYTAAATLNVSMDLMSPFLSDETTFGAFSVEAKTTGFGYAAAGYLNNTTSYTAFTITCSTGTITGGTIRVYGYRNS